MQYAKSKKNLTTIVHCGGVTKVVKMFSAAAVDATEATSMGAVQKAAGGDGGAGIDSCGTPASPIETGVNSAIGDVRGVWQLLLQEGKFKPSRSRCLKKRKHQVEEENLNPLVLSNKHIFLNEIIL